MVDKIIIKSNKLLAVEGKDEYSFFKAMLKHESLDDIQIIDIGGKDKFKIELPLLINSEGFSRVETIGFIRDSEEHKADSAFSSICYVLNQNGMPFPTKINEIYSSNNIKIGIFIMPNNIDEGMLEDLCLESVNKEPIFDCVNSYIDCSLQYLTSIKINLSKAKVQTYLACKKPIVNSLGLAALKGYWDFNNPCFSDIKLFLNDLFN